MKKYPPNSLFTWYPLIKNLGIPTPRTVMIPMRKHFGDSNEALSYGRPSTDPEMRRLVDEAQKAAHELGGYPVFLRSNESSNKHDWIDSCYITDDEGVEPGIKNIYEFTLMVMFGLDFRGVAMREFLRLRSVFKAFSGMPIAREFRFYIRKGKVLCWHPYWPPASIQRATVDDWLPRLKRISGMNDREEALLRDFCILVAEAVRGVNPPADYWSIDFCETTRSKWYLTDMARGEDSYHWATCPNIKYSDHPDTRDPEDIRETTTLKQLREKYGRLKVV